MILVNKSYVVWKIIDYGISKLQIVYYVNQRKLKRAWLNQVRNSGSNFAFCFFFPGNLAVEEGAIYRYYFEVLMMI
jgi:hypothetical protein